MLLKSPVIKLNTICDEDGTALNAAVENNNLKCIEALLAMRGINVNAGPALGAWAPLHSSAKKGNVESLKM